MSKAQQRPGAPRPVQPRDSNSWSPAAFSAWTTTPPMSNTMGAGPYGPASFDVSTGGPPYAPPGTGGGMVPPSLRNDTGGQPTAGFTGGGVQPGGTMQPRPMGETNSPDPAANARAAAMNTQPGWGAWGSQYTGKFGPGGPPVANVLPTVSPLAQRAMQYGGFGGG